MQRTLSGMVLLFLAIGSANAALLSRAGGQAYYDDVLNITWLANANLADTNDFGVSGIHANGTMNWTTAQSWIGAMNTANYLGTNTWRLPTVTTGTAGCNYANTGTACSYNVDLSTGEMAHMYYSTLGNLAYCTTGGSCPQAGWGLSNDGPFSNLQPSSYWSGTAYAPDPSGGAWGFNFNGGYQGGTSKASAFYAWAVSPGDIAAVPAPATLWLLGSAVGVPGASPGRLPCLI